MTVATHPCLRSIIGSAVVARLHFMRRFGVYVAVRGQHLDFPLGVSVHSGVDLQKINDFMPLLSSVDCVIHAAARVHVMHDTEEDPLAAFRDLNVTGTMNLARQAADAGVKRFVFISSIKVNGELTSSGRPFTETDVPNPQDAYAQSKHEAEQGLRQLSAETRMEVVIIRPPLVLSLIHI